MITSRSLLPSSSLPWTVIWQDGAYLLPATSHHQAQRTPSTVLVADSWRSRNATLAAGPEHRRRFYTASTAQIPAGVLQRVVPSWEALWAHTHHHLEQAHTVTGEQDLFPRISWEQETHESGSPRLSLQIRACPSLRAETVLYVSAEPDPRQAPTLKGPDLDRLGRYRHQGTAQGCHDVVLTAPDGSWVETATGSLVWWHRGVLTVSSHQSLMLPGTTLAQVLHQAEHQRIPIRYRLIRPEEILADPAGSHLWFLNAVQGISPVTSVRCASRPEQSYQLSAHPDTQAWQNWWWASFAPLA